MSYDTDTDTDTEEYINDTPPPDISSDFKDVILAAKKSLNEKIITGPELGSPDAQNIDLINNYLKALNNFYILSVSAQNGINVINDKNMSTFPTETKDKIIQALKVISVVFKKLNVPDRIPYESYIKSTLKYNQFQLNDPYSKTIEYE